ncbi:MAG: glutamine amidotransferase [Gemmataceae bacterium]|nr:glutamine amidotransferase [Gemmataceae bacterium]MDW8264301.1 glutamine amidotransferase [Gemmataceae bacterium]
MIPVAWLTWTHDPVWPWSIPGYGPWGLALVVVVLVGLTVWTYLGVPGVSLGWLVLIVSLRLLALLLAVAALVRPSLAWQGDMNLPSVLLVLMDRSESMTIRDEFNGQSRWEAVQAVLRQSQPLFEALRDEHNVSVLLYCFAEDLSEWTAEVQPDGKRTDHGQALQALYQRHSSEKYLRGLLIVGDGADNGTRYPALAEAARWRSLRCPISTFALGQTTTTSQQQDIAFTAIIPEPSPVPVKGKLSVRGLINAPGFENAKVRLRLKVDDKEVASQDAILRKTTGNEVKIDIDAPQTPGEIKLTLAVDPLPGEVRTSNNEISTFLTVTKEGISVLFVDKPRFPEPQLICDALRPDPRIRLFMAWRRTDEPGPEEGDWFQFDRQHYDVILIGDVTARRLTGGRPEILRRIQYLVRKGTGLLMMGGYETFGNSDWRGTPMEELLPVYLNVSGQIDEAVSLRATPDGLKHYVLRLADTEADSDNLWRRLPPLEGASRLGERKPGAAVLAVSPRGAPLLVAQTYGEGRVLAFAGDTTWQWRRLGLPQSNEGVLAHERFWKQLIIWLARQEEMEGNAWVQPDARRLPAGAKLGFSVGLRGKGGVELQDADFQVKVEYLPRSLEFAVPTAREGHDHRGTFWKTDLAGEYRLSVHARGKDHDGSDVIGDASVRFLVYQDDVEMVRPAADHEFLAKLASTGAGKALRLQDLPRFLRELSSQPLPQVRPQVELWPDWNTTTWTPFLPAYFLCFVALLTLEWGLRRWWGLA